MKCPQCDYDLANDIGASNHNQSERLRWMNKSRDEGLGLTSTETDYWRARCAKAERLAEACLRPADEEAGRRSLLDEMAASPCEVGPWANRPREETCLENEPSRDQWCWPCRARAALGRVGTRTEGE